MDRRRHRRVLAQVQGFLLGTSHEIEVVTLDLLAGGARFNCDIEVYFRKVIRVRLVIPGASTFRTCDQPNLVNLSSSWTNTKRQKAAVTHNRMAARNRLRSRLRLRLR